MNSRAYKNKPHRQIVKFGNKINFNSINTLLLRVENKTSLDENIAENIGLTEAKLFSQQNFYPSTRRENWTTQFNSWKNLNGF